MNAFALDSYVHEKDSQSDQTAEALEDVYVETADAVVGQVPVVQREKRLLFTSSTVQN